MAASSPHSSSCASLVEQGELPRVHADHAGHPAGRRVGPRELEHGVEEVDQLHLPAAPAGRLQRPQEAALQQELPRGVGQSPQLIALGDGGAELGGQGPGVLSQAAAHCGTPAGRAAGSHRPAHHDRCVASGSSTTRLPSSSTIVGRAAGSYARPRAEVATGRVAGGGEGRPRRAHRPAQLASSLVHADERVPAADVEGVEDEGQLDGVEGAEIDVGAAGGPVELVHERHRVAPRIGDPQDRLAHDAVGGMAAQWSEPFERGVWPSP